MNVFFALKGSKLFIVVPLPPLSRTMLLYPLEEDVDKYKKKSTELLKAMNEYKGNVDMTFEEF